MPATLASVLLTSVIRRLPSDRLRLPTFPPAPGHVQHPRSTSLSLVYRRAVIAHTRAFFAEPCEQEGRGGHEVTPLLRTGGEGSPAS